MPLLSPNKNVKQSVKITLNKAILDEMDLYIKHFGLADISDFLEQSAELTLSKCSEWKKVKKQLKKSGEIV